MNLRKDHYRSFTRTVRTVLCLARYNGVALSHESACLRRRGAHPASADSSGRERALCAASLSPPPSAAWCGASSLAELKHLRLARETLYENHTTLVDGYLGMSNDEERSEMRYVVRIAEFSESSNL